MVSSKDESTQQNPVKNYPVCFKCNKKMEDRTPRGALVKTFLFWLPLKRYRCYSCGRKRYVLAK